MLARCILQSQICVYEAISRAAEEEKLINSTFLEEAARVDQRGEVAKSLENFVMSAQADLAISAREAESILYPIHHFMHACLKQRSNLNDGILNRKSLESSGE
mmetsp:Transcript_110324/g.311212  ORF Transcript_110324/g.311212 Transcript_110324/m.311212 type:complete len:103 (+) Transcript_110324:170-478(+)